MTAPATPSPEALAAAHAWVLSLGSHWTEVSAIREVELAHAFAAFAAQVVADERARCLALTDYKRWSTRKCCNTCLVAAQGSIADGSTP